MKEKLAIASSGGVDSTVAAYLLKNEGYDVSCYTMLLFDNEDFGFDSLEGSEKTIKEAIESAKLLELPHKIIDLRKEFKNIVIKYFKREYSLGRTPNPCVLCNFSIKWGIFAERVLAEGNKFIASGHYAKIKKEDETYNIYKSSDEKKDQSYVLWRLRQNDLKNMKFPMGVYKKEEVKKLAKIFHMKPKEESQDICFIKKDYKDFLRDRIKVKEGDIILNGKKIGSHKGIFSYTIGQRRGLNIPHSKPLFVKEIKGNKVIVTDNKEELKERDFLIRDVSWIQGEMPSKDDLKVKIRYNSPSFDVDELKEEKGGMRVILKYLASSITKGQSAVFYRGDLLLGGGIIS